MKFGRRTIKSAHSDVFKSQHQGRHSAVIPVRHPENDTLQRSRLKPFVLLVIIEYLIGVL